MGHWYFSQCNTTNGSRLKLDSGTTFLFELREKLFDLGTGQHRQQYKAGISLFYILDLMQRDALFGEGITESAKVYVYRFSNVYYIYYDTMQFYLLPRQIIKVSLLEINTEQNSRIDFSFLRGLFNNEKKPFQFLKCILASLCTLCINVYLLKVYILCQS